MEEEVKRWTAKRKAALVIGLDRVHATVPNFTAERQTTRQSD